MGPYNYNHIGSERTCELQKIEMKEFSIFLKAPGNPLGALMSYPRHTFYSTSLGNRVDFIFLECSNSCAILYKQRISVNFIL